MRFYVKSDAKQKNLLGKVKENFFRLFITLDSDEEENFVVSSLRSILLKSLTCPISRCKPQRETLQWRPNLLLLQLERNKNQIKVIFLFSCFSFSSLEFTRMNWMSFGPWTMTKNFLNYQSIEVGNFRMRKSNQTRETIDYWIITNFRNNFLSTQSNTK